MSGLVAAVDVGGTLTKLALVARDGTPTELREVPTGLTRHPETGAPSLAVDWLVDVLREQIGAAGARVEAFGVVTPGVVSGGTVIAASNIGWYDVPVGETLRDRIGLRGAIGHDVRAGGLAEWRIGSGRGVDDFCFLPLGTGIACALVVDGQLLESGGYAGEIGHVRVPAAGELRCDCGQLGCLELVSSAAGVRRTYARLAAVDLATAPPTHAIAAQARQGQPSARAAFDLAGQGLGEALQLLCTLLGPRRISVGGGLSASLDLLRPAMDDAFARFTFQRLPELVTAELGPRAGVIGAGLLGWGA